MAVRVYAESVKKWANENKGKLGVTGVGSIITLIFIYLAMTGAITVNGHSGDMICAGTLDDPCIAIINFTANEDIFIYPIDYDPWGRNTPFSFDPNVKSWKLQRSWGSGWRTIPLNKSCTGTWCGLSSSDDTRKFSIVFREGKSYSIRILAYKEDPTQDIKWGAFDGLIDPVWKGIEKEPKPIEKRETINKNLLKQKYPNIVNVNDELVLYNASFEKRMKVNPTREVKELLVKEGVKSYSQLTTKSKIELNKYKDIEAKEIKVIK